MAFGMKITAILCTYNRCRSLAKALDSLAASILSETIEWEVLVVDNNSSDQTKQVVEDICRRYPGRFRYLFESRQGKSYALNAGIRESRGEILAFVDDDVTVKPTWLQNLTSALHDGQWGGSGGRILPAPGFSPPRWLALDGPRSLAGALYAYCDPGDVPGDLKDPPYGANMAFRREMFAKYGGFRTDLGRSSGCLLSHEDTEFGRRLMAGGERLRYVPTAVVNHEIHQYRVRKEFFLEWWFGFGRGSVRETRKRLSNEEILKVLGRTLLTSIQWVVTFESQRRFYHKCRIWYEAGKMVEVYQLARHANAPLAQDQPEGVRRA
jgi:glycosyltransferase involved in cell wall biosynthesis